MSSAFGGEHGAPVLPHRKTTVTFDEYLGSVVQPAVTYTRNADSMARSPSAEVVDMLLVRGIGWGLRGLQYRYGDAHELDDTQDAILDKSQWTTVPEVEEFGTWGQLSVPGASYAAGVAPSGASKSMQRMLGAGNSWDTSLAPDYSAFPPPAPSDDPAAMKRLMVHGVPHEPSDSLIFKFSVPGTGLHATGTLVTFYFTGPAGCDSYEGTGQYAMKFRGDGRGRLYEKLKDGTWRQRHVFDWTSGSAVYGYTHWIFITSDVVDAPELGYPGTRIVFGNLAFPEHGFPLIDLLTTAAINAIRIPHQLGGSVYRVPRVKSLPAQVAPLRVDERFDVRSTIQVSKVKYPASGTLFDDEFSLPFFPDDSVPIYLQWWGDVPEGTTLTAQLYDAETGTVLSGEVNDGSSDKIGQKHYTPTPRHRRLRVKFTATSDATRFKTPTLRHFLVWRDAVYGTPSGTTPVETPYQVAGGLPSRAATKFRIEQQGENPDSTMAVFDVQAPGGGLDVLKAGSARPVKIETTYNEAGDKIVLFRGYVQDARQHPMSGQDAGYAGKDKRNMTVVAVGEWQRLARSVILDNRTWNDPDAPGLLRKVTGMSQTLLLDVYPSTFVSSGETSPTRIVAKASDDFMFAAGTTRADALTKLIKDQLGGFILWDDSIGVAGQWRVVIPKKPPYTPLAAFTTEDPPGEGLAHMVGAYGTLPDHGDIQVAWATDFTHTVERAEGDVVVVYGGPVETAPPGGVMVSNGDSSVAKLTQVAVNVNGFDSMNVGAGNPGYPDPTHPDFIGRCEPVYYKDVTLTTQEQVDWVCRRIYDYCCHSRIVVEFTGPLLLVTDPNDAEQIRPRPLRHYDSVLFWWEGEWVDFLVDDCTPEWSMDCAQFAHYRLIRPSNLDEIAPAWGLEGYKRFIERAVGRFYGVEHQDNPTTSANRSLGSTAADFHRLPEITGPPLQDLDPSSPDFGKFYFQEGYDSYGP